VGVTFPDHTIAGISYQRMPASEVELDHRKMAMNVVEHQLGHILINDDLIFEQFYWINDWKMSSNFIYNKIILLP